MHPARGSKKSIRKYFLQDKSRVQIQTAAMLYRERPAPILRVKKIPPKKAGPKLGRIFKMCRLGTARYPASFIADILLCRLTLDKYTCMVAITWADSIPRKSARAVQELLFVIIYFEIFVIYFSNRFFAKFSLKVSMLSNDNKRKTAFPIQAILAYRAN